MGQPVLALQAGECDDIPPPKTIRDIFHQH